MSDNVEDYPFSTLHGLLGRRLLLIPVVDDTILFPDIGCTLKWLNTKPKDKHVVDIKNALGKAEFSLPIDRVTRKKNELELELF